MGANSFLASSMLLLLGVVLLGITIAFIRVYWFGVGLPPEQAQKRPGRKWLDSRKKSGSSPAQKTAPKKKGAKRC